MFNLTPAEKYKPYIAIATHGQKSYTKIISPLEHSKIEEIVGKLLFKGTLNCRLRNITGDLLPTLPLVGSTKQHNVYSVRCNHIPSWIIHNPESNVKHGVYVMSTKKLRVVLGFYDEQAPVILSHPELYNWMMITQQTNNIENKDEQAQRDGTGATE